VARSCHPPAISTTEPKPHRSDELHTGARVERLDGSLRSSSFRTQHLFTRYRNHREWDGYRDGLVVVLFLRDWRGALIVVANVPFARFTAVLLLWATSQTINTMTLGGLALAVGVLVDTMSIHKRVRLLLPLVCCLSALSQSPGACGDGEDGEPLLSSNGSSDC
jgi:hypothetical protein